jgi:hypothetical protein
MLAVVSDRLDGKVEGEELGLSEVAVEDQHRSGRRERLDGRRWNRRRRRRRLVSFTCIVLAVVCTIGVVAWWASERSWVKRTAVIDVRSCHKANSDGGPYTACSLDVSYRDPSGRSGTGHLTGVDARRIHDNTVVVYFASSTSHVAINPEQRNGPVDYVLMALFFWFVFGFVAVAVYPRRRRLQQPAEDVATADGSNH